MNWCITCQDYYEPLATSAACPTCGGALAIADDGGEYVNNGMWNIDSLGLRFAAAQSPEFNRLMVAVRCAERAEAGDMVRVGRLPRPQYGDDHHRQLSNAVGRARAAAIDHLLDHWHTLLVVQRHLG